MIDYRDLLPGTILLNLYIEFTSDASEAYSEEEFGYASFASLRTTAAIMVQRGELKIDRIAEGKAYLKCNRAVLKTIVDKVVGRRAARRERFVA